MLAADRTTSTRPRTIRPRELAYAGVFGAAALLLPTVFHVLQLGRVFMPMYLPLVALAFLVRPSVGMITALLVPLLSAAATGMPPLYPPVAVVMAVELAAMAGAIGFVVRRHPRANPLLVLVPVLTAGRVVNVALTYTFAVALGLPAGFVTALSFLSGWPGLLLMMAVVPPLVLLLRRDRRVHASA